MKGSGRFGGLAAGLAAALFLGWWLWPAGGPGQPGLAGAIVGLEGGEEGEVRTASMVSVDVGEAGLDAPAALDREAAGLGILQVTLTHGGAPVPGIRLLLRAIEDEEARPSLPKLRAPNALYCSSVGRARCELPVGRYAISVDGDSLGAGRVAAERPSGGSSQEVEIKAGEVSALALEVFTASSLSVTVVGAEDIWPPCRIIALRGLNKRPVQLRRGSARGEAIADGLAPGDYEIRPPEFRQTSFEPVLVTVGLETEESLRILSERVPAVTMRVIARSHGEGEVIPARLQFGITPVKEPVEARRSETETEGGRQFMEIVPADELPQHLLHGGIELTGGVTDVDGVIEERLAPGSYVLTIRVPRVAPPQVQLLSVDPSRQWEVPFRVDAASQASPAATEITLSLQGELAVVDLDAIGARGGHAEALGVRFAGAGGTGWRFPLWLDPRQRSARLLVDLGLLADARATVVRGERHQELAVESRLLEPGKARWSVIRNW